MVASKMGLQSELQNYYSPQGAQSHFNMNFRDQDGAQM